MTLVIDPNTDIGKAQIEAIGWAQDQMNEVAQRFFNNQYKLFKGIKFEFKFNTQAQEQEKIKIDVFVLGPQNEEAFVNAVKEAREGLGFKEEPKSKIILPK